MDSHDLAYSLNRATKYGENVCIPCTVDTILSTEGHVCDHAIVLLWKFQRNINRHDHVGVSYIYFCHQVK